MFKGYSCVSVRISQLLIRNGVFFSLSLSLSLILFGGLFGGISYAFSYGPPNKPISAIPFNSAAGGMYLGNAKNSEGAFYGKFLLPMVSNHINNVFYSYFNILQYTQPTTEANVALGYRQIFGEYMLLGGYVMADYRNTKNAGEHSQITTGLEMRYRKFFIGGNVYMPLNATITHTYNKYTPISGSKARLHGYESIDTVFYGFDITGGYQVTENIKTYVGFRYFKSAQYLDYDKLGPLLRLEYRVWHNKENTQAVKVITQYHYNVIEKHAIQAGLRFSLQSHGGMSGMAQYLNMFPFRDLDVTQEHGDQELYDKIVYTAHNDEELREGLADPDVNVLNIDGVIQSGDSSYRLNKDVDITGGDYIFVHQGKTYTYSFERNYNFGKIVGGKNNPMFYIDGAHYINIYNMQLESNDNHPGMFGYDSESDLGWIALKNNTIENTDIHFYANKHVNVSLENNTLHNSYFHIMYDSTDAQIEVPQFHDNIFTFDSVVYQSLQDIVNVQQLVYMGRQGYVLKPIHTSITVGDIENNQFLVRDVDLSNENNPYALHRLFGISTSGGTATIGNIENNTMGQYGTGGVGAPSMYGFFLNIANGSIGNVSNNRIDIHIPHFGLWSSQYGVGLLIGYGNLVVGNVQNNQIFLKQTETLYQQNLARDQYVNGILITFHNGIFNFNTMKYSPSNRAMHIGNITGNTIQGEFPTDSLGEALLSVKSHMGGNLTIDSITYNTITGTNTRGIYFRARHVITPSTTVGNLVINGDFSDNTVDVNYTSTLNSKTGNGAMDGIRFYAYNGGAQRDPALNYKNNIIVQGGFDNNTVLVHGTAGNALLLVVGNGSIQFNGGMNNNRFETQLTTNLGKGNNHGLFIQSYASIRVGSYITIHGMTNNIFKGQGRAMYVLSGYDNFKVQMLHMYGNTFVSETTPTQAIMIDMRKNTDSLTFSVLPWMGGSPTDTASILSQNNTGATLYITGTNQGTVQGFK